ncbi:MAG TPA: DHH family phosphoesterase [Candidatus Bathyarchaeia archaeon]|nr:DHH family phosphoesterase [Candidatus Bathyarchaeia archaeon]
MSETIYVTADGIYSDIDIYACSIAYAELLKLQGKSAVAVVNPVFTDSITPEISSWKFSYLNQESFDFSKAEQLIILDRSETENLQKNINLDKVIEIYDHHSGYEVFWKNKLGSNSHIEKVGSCATLIWEEYRKRGLNKKIQPDVAKLLYTAIISNTLNLKASVTSERDIKAMQDLYKLSELDDGFNARYFNAVSEKILAGPLTSLIRDTKTCYCKDYKVAIGQLEVWNGKEIPRLLKQKIQQHLPGFEEFPWFTTIASISEGKNYLFTTDRTMKAKLSKALKVTWEGDIAATSKLMLRKEIIKELQKLDEG